MSGGSDVKRGRNAPFPGGSEAKRGRVAPFPSGSDASRGRNTSEPGGDAVWLSFPNAMRIINPWISTCGVMSSCDILAFCGVAKSQKRRFWRFAR